MGRPAGRIFNMKSSYIDCFRYAVVSRIAAKGPAIIIKITDNKAEAEAFARDYLRRTGYKCSISQPANKPLVGRYRHGKGGKAIETPVATA